MEVISSTEIIVWINDAYTNYNVTNTNGHYELKQVGGQVELYKDSVQVFSKTASVRPFEKIYFGNFTDLSHKSDYILDDVFLNIGSANPNAFSYKKIPQPPQIKSIKFGFGQGAETMNNNDYDASTNPQGLQNSPSTTRGSIQKIRVEIEADYDLDPATQVEIIPYRE